MSNRTYLLLSFTGLAVLISGIVLANVVSTLMIRVVNAQSNASNKIPWYGGLAKWSFYYKPQSKYRRIQPYGSLIVKMKIAYWLCGLGFVLAIGSTLISKLIDSKR